MYYFQLTLAVQLSSTNFYSKPLTSHGISRQHGLEENCLLRVQIPENHKNTYRYSRFLSLPIDGDKVPTIPYQSNLLQGPSKTTHVSPSEMDCKCTH